MNIFFRVDSSEKIGSGHLFRCLSLADQLRKNGENVIFVSRIFPGNMCDLIEKLKFKVHQLPPGNGEIISQNKHSEWLGVSWQQDVQETINVLRSFDKPIDWMIIDHYAIERSWEERIRPYSKKIMVIDDLADRFHDCDLLLDQNLYADLETRYKNLLPEHCQRMLGPQYALVRMEFFEARRKLRDRNGLIKNILVFLGGADPNNVTVKVLKAVKVVNRPDIVVNVVVGSANPNKEMIAGICSSIPNANYFCQVDNLAKLTEDADLAVGAGGSANWERCLLALPAIIVVTAQNQLETTLALEKSGAIMNLGWHAEMNVENLVDAINCVLNDREKLLQMSKNSASIMAGSEFVPGPKKIVKAIIDTHHAKF